MGLLQMTATPVICLPEDLKARVAIATIDRIP